MADAILSLAKTNGLSTGALVQRVDELRKQTDEYASGASGRPEGAGAGLLRRAFLRSTSTIDDLIDSAGLVKNVAGVDPRLSALQRAAESLDPAQTLLRQPDAIERFFHHAAEALRRLDPQRAGGTVR